MFARRVSIRMKPGKLDEFTRMFEQEILTILQRQKGFRDEIMFSQPGDEEVTALSFWDSKEDADAYANSAYAKVLQVARAVMDGAPRVQAWNVLSSTVHGTRGQSDRQMSGGSSSQMSDGSGQQMSSGSGEGMGAGSSQQSSGRSGMAMGSSSGESSSANKEIARRFMEECWNQGKMDSMKELVADDCRYHDPAFPAVSAGAENIAQLIMTCRSGFPDTKFTIEDMIGERDEVVLHWTVSGTHKGTFMGIPATNRPCTVSGTSINRIQNGKIVEQWSDWNVMTLMEQLGMATAPKADAMTR